MKDMCERCKTLDDYCDDCWDELWDELVSVDNFSPDVVQTGIFLFTGFVVLIGIVISLLAQFS